MEKEIMNLRSALLNHLHPPAFHLHSSRRVSQTGMRGTLLRKILAFPLGWNKLGRCRVLYPRPGASRCSSTPQGR